jgi:hypothetical protein
MIGRVKGGFGFACLLINLFEGDAHRASEVVFH